MEASREKAIDAVSRIRLGVRADLKELALKRSSMKPSGEKSFLKAVNPPLFLPFSKRSVVALKQ